MNALVKLGSDLARGFVGLLYPEICSACGVSLGPESRHFCPACRTALTSDPYPTCPRCASSVGPNVSLEDGCVHCRRETLHFDASLRMAPYDGLLREQILRLKDQSGEVLAELLGELFAEIVRPRLQGWRLDLVIPIPLHWRRRWTRGFNQSELLAEAVAWSLSIPCRPRWLRRNRNTPTQTGQTPAGRRENVKGAFSARPLPGLQGRSILLVDDVMTTGSTASEAARALKRAGAGSVRVAVLAHGH